MLIVTNSREGFLVPIALVSLLVVATFFIVRGPYHDQIYATGASQLHAISTAWNSQASSGRNPAVPVSYDLSTPPSIGCEDIVSKLQLSLIEAYSDMLRGVRHANIWGYLETENKGDAAIWSAQQILLAQLGIQFEHTCRFVDKDCDIALFNSSLQDHKPYSAIIMAGGGNFNDYYWEDQPSRLIMTRTFPDIPIRAFPQSVFMHNPERIAWTQKEFGAHPDLILAARDMPSWQWLDENLDKKEGVPSVLVPDIAFMWGNRPDFRLNTAKKYDVLILARDDKEISAGASSNIPFGSGSLDLGGKTGNVTYLKVDWKFTHTPGIDHQMPMSLWGRPQPPSPRPDLSTLNAEEDESLLLDFEDQPEPDLLFGKKTFGTLEQQQRSSNLMYNQYPATNEKGKNARAWAKAVAGFQLLASAKFVITDRLHGHIMSTIIGVPHVLMDSKLGKNINFHNTWTKDCDCTRVTENITDALAVAGLYFDRDGL